MNTEPTTLALPSYLLPAVDKVVQEGRARSRDELVESALRLRLAELRRSALDAEFRHMAEMSSTRGMCTRFSGSSRRRTGRLSTRSRGQTAATGDYEAGRGL